MKKLLIAPLDWGLGHATRCVPIIRAAQSLQIPTILAASGRPKAFLQNEFPDLPIIDFEGYDIHYPEDGKMKLSMLRQAGSIVQRIHREQDTLKRLAEEYDLGAVISDNRYGLHHPDLFCVFMTHQLNIQTGGLPLTERLLKRINRRYIRHFDELWIPDFEGADNLAGRLSHPPLSQLPTYYLGPLSRFTATPQTADDAPEVLALISGPEPQRTLFEAKIIAQLRETNHTALIVCGTPEHPDKQQITDKITKIGHLDTESLAAQMAHARWVVARPGYSTLMDLAVFGKKALFVPTPGQTEQEFLAQQLTQRRIAPSVSQEAMDLKRDLEQIEDFSGLPHAAGDWKVVRERLVRVWERVG